MLVEVVEPFTTRRGIFSPGQVIDVPEEVIRKLGTKVRPTHNDLFAMIGETLLAIDQAGRPWTNWRDTLTDEHRQALKDAEQEIDRCALSGDREGLTQALDRYRDLTLGSRHAP